MTAPDREIPDLSATAQPDPGETPPFLRILTLSFLATLFFTTAGIWIIDRYVVRIDDLQWTFLILVPWVLFILELTTAMIFQVIRGVLVPWRTLRK